MTLAVTADLRRMFGLRDLEPTTEMTMTEERMALIELVEKKADGDLVREMLLHVVNAAFGTAMPQMPVDQLLTLSGIYMGLYMGGHTAKDMVAKWAGAQK